MIAVNFEKWAIAKRFFQSLILKACSAISIVFVTILISNRYSPEVAGDLFYFITLINVISVASLFGLNHTAIKYVTKYTKESIKKLNEFKVVLIYKLLLYTLFAALITAVIAFSISYYFWKELTFGIIINAFLLLYASICQGENRLFRTVAYSGFITNIAFSVIILLVDFRDIQLQTYYSFTLLITLVFAILSYKIKLFWLDKNSIKNFSSQVKRMQVNSFESTLLNQAYLWSPMIIAGIFFESKDIALFSVANRIGLSISFVISFVLLVQTQRFVANNKNVSQLESDYKHALFVSYVFSILIISMVCIFSTQVLGWFGSSYVFAKDILFLLCCAQLFQVFNGITIALLRMCEYEVQVKKVFLVSTIFLVTGTFISTHYLSILAVAGAILLSTVIQSVLLVFAVSYFWREVKNET